MSGSLGGSVVASSARLAGNGGVLAGRAEGGPHVAGCCTPQPHFCQERLKRTAARSEAADGRGGGSAGRAGTAFASRGVGVVARPPRSGRRPCLGRPDRTAALRTRSP